jgi:hypothetical protein
MIGTVKIAEASNNDWSREFWRAGFEFINLRFQNVDGHDVFSCGDTRKDGRPVSFFLRSIKRVA